MSDSGKNNRDFEQKRRYPRVETTNLLNFEYTAEDGKSRFQGVGVTKSLSEGGLLFNTDRIITPGTAVELQFTLAEKLIPVTGEVIYHIDLGEDGIDIGIRFTEISGENKIHVRDKAEETYPRFKMDA